MSASNTSLRRVISVMQKHGAELFYAKVLAANDNSKQQIYLGMSFESLNILPVREVQPSKGGQFRAPLDFWWVASDGRRERAKGAQLILYPQYPEVRLSGFLRGCTLSPSELMKSRQPGRILLLGITRGGEVLAFAANADSPIAREVGEFPATAGVFAEIRVDGVTGEATRQRLLESLARIHRAGWIRSKRLAADGSVLPCRAPNCGGYTLEAELGIVPNSYSEPDYLGWELKQFGVQKWESTQNSVITLFTPEPTGGYYRDKGVEAFVRRYGYPDMRGRADRLNFGGIHRHGIRQPRTGLSLELVGIDPDSGNLVDAMGGIALVDPNGEFAALWHYSGLIAHWNRKHNRAAYVPSMCRKNGGRHYWYGSRVRLAEGTDFLMFLSAVRESAIYYDPGIKLENESGKPRIKRRSQFRIKLESLGRLYKAYDEVALPE